MDEVLLQLQSEEAVFLFSPSLERLKDVHGTFGVARKDLQRFTLFTVEAGQPNVRLLAWSGRRKLLHSLKDNEPGIEQ